MNPRSASSSRSRVSDLENQATCNARGPQFQAMSNSNPPEPSQPQASNVVREGNNGGSVAGNTAQPEMKWTPWNVDGLYRTNLEVPEGEPYMEKWVEAMKGSDDGMCAGWGSQIDTLILFAGLFSATVTAFTIESYQWLDETPAGTLARLQLRSLLNAAQDPAINRLAPADFEISSSSVVINILWFASLTLTLAAVIIGFLCKQWLHEYQRYDNYTTKDAVLIHGLRYRGLQAWRVPEIIAFLPILLQTALMLFLVGLLVLLGPLQTAVASIISIIVGLTFLFLSATTLLPAIQYVCPKFQTQCPYKSSQSWSFFFISASWRFGSGAPTSWTSLDYWEVTSICGGMGHTLSRVYELVSNDAKIFQSIYGFLADTSRSPSVKADLVLLSDFVDGLDALRKDGIIKAVPKADEDSFLFQRLQQLKIHFSPRPGGPVGPSHLPPEQSFDEISTTSHAYQMRVQKTFTQFLKLSDTHLSDQAIFNRYLEHWARCNDSGMEDMKDLDISYIGPHHTWNSDIASHIVKFHSRLLKSDQTPNTKSDLPASLFSAFPGMMKSYQHSPFNPAPFTLLKDVQNWISRDTTSKSVNVGTVLLRLVHQTDLFSKTHKTGREESEYLRSFAEFFVGLEEKDEDIQNLTKSERWEGQFIQESLETLRNYLLLAPPTSS